MRLIQLNSRNLAPEAGALLHPGEYVPRDDRQAAVRRLTEAVCAKQPPANGTAGGLYRMDGSRLGT